MAEKPDKAQKSQPNVHQRRVAKSLRRWRLSKSPTPSQEQLAKSLNWSTPKLNRLETGAQIAGIVEVIGIATMLGVADAERDRVLAWVKAGLEGAAWWRAFGSDAVPDYAADYLDTEAIASWVGTLQQVVHGLLQAPGYMRALMSTALTVPSEAAREERGRLRLQRQSRLDDADNPLQLHAVIPESVLRQLVGDPSVMVDQMDLLINRAGQSNVTVQVVGAEQGAYPGIGNNYDLLRFADGDTDETEALYLENQVSGLFVEESPTIDQYKLSFKRLARMALEPEPSLQRLVDIRADWAAQ